MRRNVTNYINIIGRMKYVRASRQIIIEFSILSNLVGLSDVNNHINLKNANLTDILFVYYFFIFF